MIPYGRQNISQADIDAVVGVLKSDFITQGPAIERFEKAVADSCGAKYAVAVSSATAALHIACLAADLGEGDILWTSPNTFVASANCGRYCGADVDFVDIDSRSYNLSVDALKQKLENEKQNNKLPKVLVPVHFSGQSCEMETIHQLAKDYNFTVIEDASHAIGGSYQGQRIGNCRYSDMTVFSFHPVKIVTTGEGGMITTNREDLYQKLIRLRSHGITRDQKFMTGNNDAVSNDPKPKPRMGPTSPIKTEPNGSWYYEQLELGFNYRMTDIQAALGASQMTRLDEFVKCRQALAKRYDDLLKGLPLITPWQHPETESAFHLYVIRLKQGEINVTHREVFESLRASGIGVNLHYIPVHTQPYYQQLGFNWGDFPEAEQYYREAISLPLFYDLSEAEQDQVVTALKQALTLKTSAVTTTVTMR